MPSFGSIRVGRALVSIDDPSHVDGIREGNGSGHLQQDPGYQGNGKWTARRSTSINPHNRQPIDPRMPVLPPA